MSAGAESSFGEGGIPVYPDNHKPADWTELKPDLLDKDNLVILGKPVMESWEKPYMAALALTAAQNGGRVLEIGFGLGIASSFIQSSPTGVTEHVVIEANAEVFKSLQDFASKSKVPVTPKLGLWQNVVSELEDASFDGILFDTYPISEEELHTHQTTFFKHAQRLLKPGGVLSYCNLTSWGRLKLTQPNDRKMFEESQLPALLAAGFDGNKCKIAVVSVDPPAECKYFTHKTVPVPVIEK